MVSTSPRKTVPLASGEDWTSPTKASSMSASTITRAFFCGVVVEGGPSGVDYSENVQELLLSFGVPVDADGSGGLTPSNAAHSLGGDGHPRKRAMTDTSALQDVIQELVTTERSYVQRLRHLKKDYADPLRSYSRSKETSLLPGYEANTLFGNIDNLVPVNEAFLSDLERMLASDGAETGGVGDVALRHFKQLRGFEQYKQYYSKRDEAQAIFVREYGKSKSPFANYVDRIKYSGSTAEVQSRVGLRELLMEPVQRVPRYTLLFRTMIKYMGPSDPQRAKLVEADEIASKIARAETDEQMKSGTIMYCLGAAVEGFPPSLISHSSRKFLDCIDVQDVVVFGDATKERGGGATAQSTVFLHCSLFLFDDKLVLVKRPGNGEKGAKTLAGLQDLDKATKGGKLSGVKKSGMVCKGVFDITDVVATDAGGSDMHIFLEQPPQDDTDRWSGRPFRALTVVQPPSPAHLNPTVTEVNKKRFLERLWNAQAQFRTRNGQSVILCSKEREVESKAGVTTLARTYFNVYQRTAFLKETKKTKIVVHIDEPGAADNIPFGTHGPPFVVVRIQPMAGEVSRYTVTSNDPTEEPEEDIVQTVRVASRVVSTINQYGLFKFRTGDKSAPSTPSSSARSRASIFGLDAISRNLFNARPGALKGELFGGSINGSYRRTRSKSAASRASMYSSSTGTMTSADSNFTRSSRRSNSTAITMATTVSSSNDDEASFFSSKLSLKRSKSNKRSKSPGLVSESEIDSERSLSRTSSRSGALSRSSSASRSELDYSDVEDAEGVLSQVVEGSDWSLTQRLELARRNSQNQHESATLSMEHPLEDTIYEDEPPMPLRPLSRAATRDSTTSRDSASQHSTITPMRPSSRCSGDTMLTVTQRPTTPISRPASPCSISGTPSRNHSKSRSEGSRPMGPRPASPLPPTSPRALPAVPIPQVDLRKSEMNLETALKQFTELPATPQRSNLPRSQRVPLESTTNTPTRADSCRSTPSRTPSILDHTPKPAHSRQSESVEPLSIKKKVSTRSSTTIDSTTSAGTSRRGIPRSSPMRRLDRHTTTAQTASSSTRQTQVPLAKGEAVTSDVADRLLRLMETTREDTETTSRAVKRIRLEVDRLRSSSDEGNWSRPSSPEKGVTRTPTNNTPMSKAAQARMDEMRKLIGQRTGDGTSPTKARPRSAFGAPSELWTNGSARGDDVTQAILEPLDELDHGIARLSVTHDEILSGVKTLAAEHEQTVKADELKATELKNSKRQLELVKSLLADCTTEKEIMYEAFNEELESLYQDSGLPDDEAWKAMTQDLKRTKEARNTYANENSRLKRKLAELEVQQQQWGELLRSHGLIP